ncbi:MAG: hypothetical protein ACYSWO_00190 [Planctomycetota bacterium]
MKRGVYVGILSLVLCTSSLAEQLPARIVNFPKDRAVGRLKVRDMTSHDGARESLLRPLGWKLLGQAQGEMIVPAQKECRLEIYRDSVDISFLSRLGANDLDVLSLRETDILDEDLAGLRRLTGLKALDLNYASQLEGEGLAHLADLQSLEELGVAGTHISDAALMHISGLTALERLSLRYTDVRGSGLVHLKNVESLKYLDLWETPVTDGSLAHLRHMTRLKDLNICNTKIRDEGLKYLKGLSSLERLSIGCSSRNPEVSPITDAGLAHLGTLTSLRRLVLYRTRITDAGLAHLRNLTSLTNLIVFETPITDAGLVHLRGLTALEGLDLSDSQITGRGLARLGGLSQLKWLGLHNSRVTSPGIGNLKLWSATLEGLLLSDTPVSDTDLSHLVCLKKLKYLYIPNTAITDAGLVHLARLKSLESLDLNNTKVTDEGLTALRNLPNLRRIDVLNTGVTMQGLERFKRASASKSIMANVRSRMVVTKDKGPHPVRNQLPLPNAKPRSLLGKTIPAFEEIKIDLKPKQTKGHGMLLCFFDMDQRPSRNCMRRLNTRARELEAKKVQVAAIHASNVDQNTLDEWLKAYRITFPVGMLKGDAERILLDWGVESLPWLILTDSERIVRAEGFGLRELSEKLDRDTGD